MQHASFTATLTERLSAAVLETSPPPRELYAIVGRGALGSLSPRLHNAAYRHLGLPALYLPVEATSDFAEVWAALARAGDELGLPWRGFTLVAPYKGAVSEVADEVSAVAERAAAANLLTRTAAGAWRADTTDPQGVLEPLQDLGVELRGRPAAVLGAGGAGRAAALALADAGARVTLVHRRREPGRHVARRLGVGFADLDTFRADAFTAVVHATPVGRDGVASAFDTTTLAATTAVVDMVYGDVPTPLVTAARSAGCPTADGHDVLLAETRQQVRAMTGHEVPGEILRSNLSLGAGRGDTLFEGTARRGL